MPVEVIKMKNKELIYWIDLTGPTSLDEIIRLTIIDPNNQVLFNRKFDTKQVDYWDSNINGIIPESLIKEPLFEESRKEIQKIFDSSETLITFYGSTSFLEKQGINLANKTIIDLADSFRVLGDSTDTIENLCIYYGYPLTDNVFERTGIDYAKGINFCYHEMENNRKAQEN